MEARAELEQRGDASVDDHRASRRLHHARDDLQQRRLAGAVLADDPERLAALHRKRHAVERAKRRHRRVPAQQPEHQPKPAADALRAADSPCRRRRGRAMPSTGNPRSAAQAAGTSKVPHRTCAAATATASASLGCERKLPVEQRVAQARHEPAERIGRDPGTDVFRHQRERIEDRRQVHHDHQDRHQHVLDVAHEDLQRRQRERQAGDREHQHEPQRNRDDQPLESQRLAEQLQHAEHDDVAGEIQHERRGDRGVHDRFLRKRRLADQPGVAGQAHRGPRQRFLRSEPRPQRDGDEREKARANRSCRRGTPT